MALDNIPSWLNVHPQDFVQAGQQGAETGLGVARLEQAGQQHSAQLAQEANRQRQIADYEAAQLSQHEHLAEMEMQARREIAQQNRLREDQQHLITNAYHQAEVGLGRDRIDQRNALADAISREKAATYAEESGLAQHIAKGGTMAEGLMKFPRARGIAAALKANQAEADGAVTVQDVPGIGKVIKRAGSSHWQVIPTEKPRVIQDHKDGSIRLLHPDGTLQVVKPPVASATDEMTGLNGNTNTNTTATSTPGIFSRLFGGGSAAAPATPFKEGQPIRNRKDGKMYVVKGGIPVPVEEAAAPAAAATAEPANEVPDTTTDEEQ